MWDGCGGLFWASARFACSYVLTAVKNMHRQGRFIGAKD
jgi:hypothetical protein